MKRHKRTLRLNSVTRRVLMKRELDQLVAQLDEKRFRTYQGKEGFGSEI